MLGKEEPCAARVLLIDDHEPDNVFHRLILEESGIASEIMACEDVDAAVALLCADRDPRGLWVFLDVHLPAADGWSVARELARRFAERIRGIVMLSSLPAEDETSRLAQVPLVRGVWTKPFDARQARGMLCGSATAHAGQASSALSAR